MCLIVPCSVLQFVAACCSANMNEAHVLQCVAVCCSVLQCVAVCCSVLQCVAMQYERGMSRNRAGSLCVLHGVVVLLQCVAVHT